MTKQNRNLSLDSEAIRRGERYSELHDTNISKLVNSFLSSLPMEDEKEEISLSPAVRRLFGIASDGKGVERYRRHLVEKYGK